MIEYVKLLIDFGLLILAWVVQLAIYPGFKFFTRENLKAWHPSYSLGISWVVAPLMVTQLGIGIYLATVIQSWFIFGNLLLVIATWVITFFWAIPLHTAIDKNDNLVDELDKLIKVNRFRAWIWTIICVWTLWIMTF